MIRSICCWWCKSGNHAHCALPKSCACYRCYPRSTQDVACTLCSGVCSWACFGKKVQS